MGWRGEGKEEKLFCDCCGEEIPFDEIVRECRRCEGYICVNCIRYNDSAIPEEQELCVNCHNHLKEISVNHLSREMNW